MTTCGIHAYEDTTSGRCTVCTHLARRSGWRLPEELTLTRYVGSVPIFATTQDPPATPWANLLDMLPTITQAQTADLKVDTGDTRVWQARTTTADGEPFDRTIYVETLSRGRWLDVGYFDGDETDPRPVGTLGDAWNATYRRLGVDIH